MIAPPLSEAFVCTENLKQNFRCAAKKVFPAKVIPVIKANAYGHGIVPVARACEEAGAEKIAVAQIREGILLREAGIRLPILIMGAVSEIPPEEIVRLNLTPSVFRLDQLRTLAEFARFSQKKIPIHLKFDTGMNRVGITPEETGEWLEELSRSPGLQIEGIYSHFACADTPEHPLNQKQKEVFSGIIERFEAVGYHNTEKHLCNSAGIFYHSDAYHDAVRLGISLYGIAPGEIPLPQEMKPVMSLRTRINFSKTIKKGSGVSYGNTWQASEDCCIATLPLGYGDGFSRAFSGKNAVFEIQNKLFPVVGRVCMDLCMICTGKELFPVGEKVEVFGEFGKNRAEDLAKKIDSIPYEIVTGLSQRIPRIYT